VTCSGQPQSEPGTGCGTPIVSTTALPLAEWNTRRAAIRRIVRGAAKDLLITAERILSGRAGGRAMSPSGATCVSAARRDIRFSAVNSFFHRDSRTSALALVL